MNVEELIEQLQHLPGNLPVLIEGYETGWDGIHELRTAGVVPYRKAEAWDGEYHLATEFKQAGRASCWPQGRETMKVSELVAQLQLMPQELEVMLPFESNLDHALRVGIVQVANTDRDWSGTPMGNYRVIDGDDTEVKTGKPLQVVVIDLEKSL